MTPTDKPMTVDALIENTRLAWYLGQRYWQQADSESYADNKRSALTLEKFNKLLESSRAAIEQYGREQREAAATSKQVEDCVPAPPFDPAAEPPWHRSDMGPAGRGSGEPVAWGQLGTLNGQLFLRSNYDRTPYPPPPSIVRNLNLVPLYTAPQSLEPLTDEQINQLWCACLSIANHAFSRDFARAIERAHNIRSEK